MRKGDKRLKYEDRKEIEKMKNDGVRVVVIAEKIGVHGEYEESRNRRKS